MTKTYRDPLTPDELDEIDRLTGVNISFEKDDYVPMDKYIISYFSFYPRGTDKKHLIQQSLLDKGAVIIFKSKDVGAFFKEVPRGYKEYLVTVKYLKDLPYRKNLNTCQLLEVESLLNRVGESLNITFPPVPTPSRAEMKQVLIEALLVQVMETPLLARRNFRQAMLSAGFEYDIDKDDFDRVVTDLIRP